MHIGFATPVYITSDAKGGGLGTYVRKTGLQLSERNHSVSIFHWSDRNRHWEDGPLNIHEVKRLMFPRRLKQIPQLKTALFLIERSASSSRLKKCVFEVHKSFPIDILQTANYQAPAYSMRKNGQFPMVCRLSSYSPLWTAASGFRRSLEIHLGDWLESRQVLDSDAVISPSAFLAHVMERFEGTRPEIIRTGLEALPEASWDWSFYKEKLENKKYLLFFGNLSKIKGVDILAEMSHRLLSEHTDLFLIFIGPVSHYSASQKMDEYIYEQAGVYKDRVVCSAPIDKSLLFPVILNASGVLMPSRVDNYPNACLESHFLGVPVVGSYDSSLEEMIIDGKTGFLSDNGNLDSLWAAVERLLSMTEDQCREMRENINRVNEERLQENTLVKLEDLYNEVIRHFRCSLA